MTDEKRKPREFYADLEAGRCKETLDDLVSGLMPSHQIAVRERSIRAREVTDEHPLAAGVEWVLNEYLKDRNHNMRDIYDEAVRQGILKPDSEN